MVDVKYGHFSLTHRNKWDTLPGKIASKSDQHLLSYKQFSLKIKGEGQMSPKSNHF